MTTLPYPRLASATLCTRTGRLLASALLATLLGACGGGGGGSPAPIETPPTTPTDPTASTAFVRFGVITAPSSVRAEAFTQEAIYRFDTTTQKVTEVGTVSPFAAGAIYDATYTTSGSSPAAVRYTSAAGTIISIDTRQGDTLQTARGLTIQATASGENYVLTPSLGSFAWDYQTAGIWTTGGGTGSGTIGAVSLGAATSASAIPTTGNGTFAGLGLARTLDAAGAAGYTIATTYANVDFGNRRVVLSASGTVLVDEASGNATTSSDLNLSGTLNYSADSNQFSGTVSTTGSGANPAMSGTATGRFYGPSAQEFSGTFALTDGLRTYLGAFGGKKP